jgi:hypothetical protein
VVESLFLEVNVLLPQLNKVFLPFFLSSFLPFFLSSFLPFFLPSSSSFERFGKIRASGHWSHKDVHSKHNISDVFIQPAWSYDWASLITEHISKLRPKPKYLVFNAGLWHHDLGDAAVRESIEHALNATDIVGIYKTTTFQDGDGDPDTFARQHDHDAHVCKSMQNRCIDVSWTKNLSGPEHYWDRGHFRSHVYTAMNMQLLNLLVELH